MLSTTFCFLMLDFFAKKWIRFSYRDKRLFKITEVEITRVECTMFASRLLAVNDSFVVNMKSS